MPRLGRIARRRALAGLLASAALVSAAPAHAADPAAGPDRCATALERLEQQAYAMQERHDWYWTLEWWDHRWQAYYQSCIDPKP